MGISLSHLFMVLLIVLLVFGTRRMPQIMNDLAKGIKAFRDGLKDSES